MRKRNIHWRWQSWLRMCGVSLCGCWLATVGATSDASDQRGGARVVLEDALEDGVEVESGARRILTVQPSGLSHRGGSCSCQTDKCQCGSGGGDSVVAGSDLGGETYDSYGDLASDDSGLGYAMGPESAEANLPGYIDPAVIQSRVRLRFDAGFDNAFPDRAEFFYAQCGCFGVPTARGPGSANPLRLASSVNYQEYGAYLEYAVVPRLSGFVELPIRSIDFQLTPAAQAQTQSQPIADATGLSDITAGIRYGLIAEANQAVTFQLRVYTPTGDAGRGLGTAHASLEPALLAQHRWTEDVNTFGEVRVWVPFSDATAGGANFAGPVLRYGLGASYRLHEVACDDTYRRLDGVVEFVGWTVLDGQKLDILAGPESARGDTIGNIKVGLRGNLNDHSLFVGYGHCVTQEAWYSDILRVDYTIPF